jgi:N-acetylmuramoyl-L-alanine amidase
LAQRYKTSVSKLQAANNIKDARSLRIGQRLVIPGSGTSSAATTKSNAGSSAKSSSSASRSGAGKRVIIDPGHGGKDHGACHGGVRESSLNLRIASRLEGILKRRGYSVAMTRRSDTFVSLSRRAAIANGYRNAIFVSIHLNSTRSSWVRGIETFYAGSSEGRALATSVQREVLRKCKATNRGVRYARYTVLVQTKCPAILVEGGFLSNASERARVSTSSYQENFALGIADGIANYRWK